MATIGRLVVQIGADVGGLTAGLQTAQSKLRGFGSQLRGVGMGLSLGVTAPITGIAVAALNSARGFEQSMNLMQATTGASGAQMAALQQQALDLGATTSFSAGEAAGAMLELAKAGMSVEQTSAAIPGVMDLAAAGGIGLADAATITANAINSFGLEAGAATGVANTFAAAANASSADVGDLAAGFQMAGAVFSANGQSVDDLAASLAILANNGIAGSDAGTSLKTMMMRLAAPTDEAAGVMKTLGLNVYDANGAMLPFGQIVGQLETATTGMGDAQRNAALSTLFGADAIRAATILAGEGGTAYEQMMGSVTKQGAAALLADAQMKGLSGAIEYFKGSVDSLLIGSALPFMETMAGMVRNAADLLAGLATLSPETQRFAAVLLAVLAVAGPLLMILGTMATALAGLLSPVGLVIVAVGLLGVGFATNFMGMRDAVMNAWAAIQPYLTQAYNWFVAQLPAALAILQAWFTTAWNGASAAVGAMWGIVQPVLAQLMTWFSASLPGALTTAQGAFTTALTAIQTLWQTLVGLFGPSIQRIQTAFLGLGTSTAPMLPALQGLGTAFQTLWTTVQPLIVMLGQVIGAIVGVAAVTALNGLATAIGAIGPVLTILVSEVTVAVQFISTTIGGMVAIVQLLIAGDFAGAWASAQEIMAAFGEFVLATLQNMLDLATTIFTGLYNIVYNTLTDLGVDMETVMSGVVTWWQEKWSAMVGFVQPVLNIIDSLKTKIQSFKDWIGSISIPNPFSGISIPSWVPGFAAGTMSAPGGLALVGERGPELVNLPRGARVWSNSDTRGMLAGAGGGEGGPTINMGPVYMGDKMDVEAIAYRVATIIERRRR